VRFQRFAGQAGARAEVDRVPHAAAGFAGVEAQQFDQQRGGAADLLLGGDVPGFQFGDGGVPDGRHLQCRRLHGDGELQQRVTGQGGQVGAGEFVQHGVDLLQQVHRLRADLAHTCYSISSIRQRCPDGIREISRT